MSINLAFLCPHALYIVLYYGQLYGSFPLHFKYIGKHKIRGTANNCILLDIDRGYIIISSVIHSWTVT